MHVRLYSYPVIAALALGLAIPAFATRTHRAAPAAHKTSSHKSGSRAHGKTSAKATPHKLKGQQAIASERVKEIQEALIREHYMTGEASGQWDATTQAAMQKYQGDQGWQTRLMPDSRALKKLGLGPDYSGAINAKETASRAPAPAATIPTEQAAGFAAAAGVN